jgi:hypothetical protein
MKGEAAQIVKSRDRCRIELDVEDVKRVAEMYEDAPPEIRTFLDTIHVRELCADWMKLRARHA